MKWHPNMTAEEEQALVAEVDRIDACYADCVIDSPASEDEEQEDPVRDGWVDKQGRP
jgi:hypothetical protein